LLRDYLAWRLSLNLAKAEQAAVADTIIGAANSRFAYVSFLADQRETGQIAASEIGPTTGSIRGCYSRCRRLQGVIWVSRAGTGTTRFRLALKEFLPAAKDDPIVGPMLPLMHNCRR
jgi:hypothetical protein